MNLKEAFQMQKILSRLLEEAASYLDDTDNVMTVTEKHLAARSSPSRRTRTWTAARSSTWRTIP